MQNYNHADFVKCIEVGDFAKIFENQLKCKCGKQIGRNKIYQVFKDLGFCCKDNSPAQAYAKHFKYFVKYYQQGDNTIVKKILLIKRESMEFLLQKIREYVALNCVHKVAVKSSFDEVVVRPQEVEVSCPLDFGKDEAIAWYKSLPEIAKNTYFAKAVADKWGLIA